MRSILDLKLLKEFIPTRVSDVSLGNALILVHASRYELGATRPKFSGLRGRLGAVMAYRLENWDFHTIILVYTLRKLSMLLPTSPSLTKILSRIPYLATH